MGVPAILGYIVGRRSRAKSHYNNHQSGTRSLAESDHISMNTENDDNDSSDNVDGDDFVPLVPLRKGDRYFLSDQNGPPLTKTKAAALSKQRQQQKMKKSKSLKKMLSRKNSMPFSRTSSSSASSAAAASAAGPSSSANANDQENDAYDAAAAGWSVLEDDDDDDEDAIDEELHDDSNINNNDSIRNSKRLLVDNNIENDEDFGKLASPVSMDYRNRYNHHHRNGINRTKEGENNCAKFEDGEINPNYDGSNGVLPSVATVSVAQFTPKEGIVYTFSI